MQSAQMQILSLLAAERIDFSQAERLLLLLRERNRFFTLTFWTILCVVLAAVCFPHSLLAENLSAVLSSRFPSMPPSVTGSEAFRNLQIFIFRVLGELP